MNSNKLAIFGGSPLISEPFKTFSTIGNEEIEATLNVVKSGVLSAYIGAAGSGFMGGKNVKEFEEKAANYFKVDYAIAVNSWTSGLIAAVGAIGIEPGDEIITTPWTMAATSTAILHFNGIPIFADIELDSFNIDPSKVEALITNKTKAIMAVDIFGQSANMKELKKIAKKHNLKIISDTAQAPGALYNKKYAGTLADIGGYSLNYHKHIHCGEGGILVTNDYDLAQRLRMLRNHAEAVIDSNSPNELCNMLGFNFRMGEIEASIASCQLDKLNTRVLSRQIVAANLNEGLSSLKGLKTPRVSDESTHVYYVYGLTLDLDLINTTREKIISALEAEGVPGIMRGYQNLHLLPMFRNKIAYGTSGFPWSSDFCTSNVEYKEGLCPIAEELHSKTFFGLNICMYELDEKDVDLVISSFKKVWENLELL